MDTIHHLVWDDKNSISYYTAGDVKLFIHVVEDRNHNVYPAISSGRNQQEARNIYNTTNDLEISKIHSTIELSILLEMLGNVINKE